MKVSQQTKKTKLDLTLSLIVNLFKLNGLWILFTLSGAIVAGIYPATITALVISRKWLLTKDYTVTTKEFYTLFKKEFKYANIYGLAFTLAGAILLLNYHLLTQLTGSVPIVVPIAYYILLFSYFTTLLWFFPLYVHRDNNFFNQLKNAFIIGVLKLPITLLQIIATFVLLYISLALPTMFIFFTFAILSVLWMKWTLKGILSINFNKISQ
ncbi:YesL family protein [Marinilactibacillus kalidii]|uniref:YesL family protein n=1 Tax=Marinilactibacillus kalidii TaxID=2820274 RepID=UPI001ABE20AA|nr:DUF624 domain-containing protein [Marinilactibacillus kalidii]